MKTVAFVGSSLDDLRDFPEDARGDVGPGVREIRVRDATGAFRVIYVASFDEAIYVLHAFQKKTQKTARGDLALAKDRYQEVLMRRKSL